MKDLLTLHGVVGVPVPELLEGDLPAGLDHLLAAVQGAVLEPGRQGIPGGERERERVGIQGYVV